MSLFVLAHQKLAHSELEDFRAYALLVTGLIENEASRHKSHVTAALAEMSKEERIAYAFDKFDQYEKLTDRFPNLQQASLLVLGYALAESQLLTIARRILSQSGTELTLKDLAGDSPIHKARKCLTKIGKFELDEPIWSDLEAYRQLRNAIAHSSGHFFDDQVPQPVQRLMVRCEDVEYSKEDGVTLSTGYLVHFLQTLDGLHKTLFNEWRRVLGPSAA